MTILLLAMSTKHHSMPTEPWDHAFLWPTELQIRTWTVQAAVGKDSDATLRRTSRLSGQAVATGVDLPKEEIPGVSKLRLTTSASASTDFDVTQDGYRTQRRIKAYQINGNDSFRPVRIEKWQNPDVLKIRRRRSALPECVQFDLPDVDPDIRLDFEHFLHSGSLSDVYFGSLHIKDQPSVQVAIKVVVPDLCFRAADLPKDTGNDQQMIPDDGSSSRDDQQSQPSLSAEEARALIIAEARNYLTCLIDSPASPAFYGLWQGKSAAPRLPRDELMYDNHEILLLITEHLPQSFIPATASQQDWSDIKERHYQLDNLGIAHAALPANWRAKDDAWYMIDYAQTESDMNPPATWNQGLAEWQKTIQEWCDLATDAVYSMEPRTPPPPVDRNKNLRAAMD